MPLRKERKTVSLDALITDGLHASVAQVQPSPDVWQRIENKLKRPEQTPPRPKARDLDTHPQYLRG